MKKRGFVKYRLPKTQEIVSKTGFWTEKDRLQGLKNLDFLISTYDNQRYFIFEADEECGTLDTRCYFREEDDELNTEKEFYLKKVESLVSDIHEGKFRKIIFSRRKEASLDSDPFLIFEKLNHNYTNSFNYVAGIEGTGLWVGATPEVLIQEDEQEYLLHALAGTMPRNKRSEYNWTQKEVDEQRFVTDYILSGLDNSGITDVKINGPFNFEHAKVAHLKTELRIKANLENLNELLRHLPPTPAVCGIPKDSVLKEIQEIEGYNRRFYTGIVGVNNKNGVNFFVNLRCAELFSDKALVYVGGGITSESDPEKEWIETELKSQTIIDIIEEN